MTSLNQELRVEFHASIDEIAADAWDALCPDANPFVSHTFLLVLEQTGCIRPDWGWQAHHLGLYQGEQLLAAAPLYLKGNSHGEFVFDWSWAHAWERAGGDYYPKLLNAVPYSPVTGARLLAGKSEYTAALQHALVEAMRGEAERLRLSSVHANFLPADELPAFDIEWLARSDVQFHWHNREYHDFDDFLAALNHKKRKNIQRERRQAESAGLSIEWRSGDSLGPHEWQQVHALYETNFDAKGNHAALTSVFFTRLGELGKTAQIALARDAENIVAMALFIQGNGVLYGRYWGAVVNVPGLHFELCYYRGIEYAITNGLSRFEPGAQGEYKLARGFLPTLTHSRHYLVHEGFRGAVRDALAGEALHIEGYRQKLLLHDPYGHR